MGSDVKLSAFLARLPPDRREPEKRAQSTEHRAQSGAVERRLSLSSIPLCDAVTGAPKAAFPRLFLQLSKVERMMNESVVVHTGRAVDF